MRQTSGFISTYSADVFGVCSALYELGGMIVMHDASGCNSTYTTHDEPRWYDMDSMVYISGLTEIEAIMGDSTKFVGDVIRAAKELSPEFIAIAGTPIPAMTGFDIDAAAYSIEAETGIPVYGFNTTGMKSYIHGAGEAFACLAEKAVLRDVLKTDNRSANILGLTPLDFSVNGYAESVCGFVEAQGYQVLSSWAMGASLKDIARAGAAHENFVVSETGLKAAEKLKEIFGTPYRSGIPVNGEFMDVGGWYHGTMRKNRLVKINTEEYKGTEVLVLGEGISTLSLAKYIFEKKGLSSASFASTDADEDEIAEAILSVQGLKTVIADPLFERLLKALKTDGQIHDISFIPMPHEAFSGRIYRKNMVNPVDGFYTTK